PGMPGGTGSYLDRALAAHMRSRRYRLWAAVLAVLAVILAFLPLVGSLGFELSFIIALFASFAAADLGCAFVRRARADPTVYPIERHHPPGRVVLALWARASLAALVLLLPPLAIACLNALRVRQCDWIQGGAFYALLPGISVPLASAAGVA